MVKSTRELKEVYVRELMESNVASHDEILWFGRPGRTHGPLEEFDVEVEKRVRHLQSDTWKELDRFAAEVKMAIAQMHWKPHAWWDYAHLQARRHTALYLSVYQCRICGTYEAKCAEVLSKARLIFCTADGAAQFFARMGTKLMKLMLHLKTIHMAMMDEIQRYSLHLASALLAHVSFAILIGDEWRQLGHSEPHQPEFALNFLQGKQAAVKHARAVVFGLNTCKRVRPRREQLLQHPLP